MKLCKYCNKYPVFGGGYCKYHQSMRNDKKPYSLRKSIVSSDMNNTSKKVLKSNRKAKTGELELFKEIWNERPRVSEISGEKIPFFSPMCFHHLLPKSRYPELRLTKDNIVVLTREEHFDVHNVSIKDLIKKCDDKGNNKWIVYNKLYDVVYDKYKDKD